MKTRDMVRMANQIATFCKGYGETAAMETADHINRFWDPRMRKTLLAYLAKGGEGLDPLVKESVAAIRPPPAASP